MTTEELFKKNFPEYITEKGECLSPYWDLFSAGYETLEKENAELKKELTKRSEQIEALNKDKVYFSDALDKQIEATYKVVEELNEAKNIIAELVGVISFPNIYGNLINKANNFLKGGVKN